MAKVNKLASWLQSEYYKGNKVVKFLLDHENLLFGTYMAAGLSYIFLSLGHCMDKTEEQKKALEDAIVVARTAIHECPEAEKIIDEHLREKIPEAAGIKDTLAYFSEKGKVALDDLGDTFAENWKHVVTVPNRTVYITVKKEAVNEDEPAGEAEKQND